ncbi:MAG TPA: multidrug efflux SMR transporter [Edaphocola sp.]|nr:multidrug efflux SMR transporter [Edaphocola sp.]
MNWIILIIAGLCEVGFATCLGYAQKSSGSTAIAWYIGFILFLTISMILLIKAVHTIPLGTAYAVWTGIGAVGTVLMGIFFFKEPVTFWKMFFMVTLIGSIVGLKAISI